MKRPDRLHKLTLKIGAEAHAVLMAGAKTRARSAGWLVSRAWGGTLAWAKHDIWTRLPAPTYEEQELVTIYVPKTIYDDIHAAAAHHDRSMGWLVSVLILGLDPEQRRALWTVQPQQPSSTPEAVP